MGLHQTQLAFRGPSWQEQNHPSSQPQLPARKQRSDLQVGPLSQRHSGVTWYPRRDSNPQPLVPKTSALSVELRGHAPRPVCRRVGLFLTPLAIACVSQKRCYNGQNGPLARTTTKDTTQQRRVMGCSGASRSSVESGCRSGNLGARVPLQPYPLALLPRAEERCVYAEVPGNRLRHPRSWAALPAVPPACSA